MINIIKTKNNIRYKIYDMIYIYICCILCRHVDCICTILVIVKQLKYTPSGSLSAVLSHKTLFFSSCLLYSC